MYLLYLDGSGSVTDPNEDYFVLGGVAVFERQAYWRSKALDEEAEKIDPHSPQTVEFHGTEIHSGRKRWRRLSKADRVKIINGALGTVHNGNPPTLLFGAAVNKAAISPRDPVEYAFEQVCNRYDRFLGRFYARERKRERGLIIIDESTYETRLQALATNFRTIGHSWGVIRNLVEVPLFVDSKASRLVQLADLIAYAMFRFYEKEDPAYFNTIKNKYDSEGNVIHGLVHYTPENDDSCNCPICEQRRRQRQRRSR